MGRIAKGGREEGGYCETVLQPLFASFSIHPAPHSKLGSEVAKYLVKAKQKSRGERRLEILTALLLCLVGEPLENNHETTQSLSKWIK